MRLHDGRRPRWPAVLARPLAWMLVLAMLPFLLLLWVGGSLLHSLNAPGWH